MTAFTDFLSQAHRYRHLFTKPYQAHLSFFLHNHLCYRLLSSTRPQPSHDQPDPIPSPNPNTNPRTPIHVQPVSYSVRKTVEENPPESPPQNPNIPPSPPFSTRQPHTRPGLGPDRRSDIRAWTREDVRFVKDSPSFAPVSYPTKVAPLPEDRVVSEEVKEDQEMKEKKGVEGDFERERSRIESAQQILMRRASLVKEEKVPFPTLIIQENNRKEKAVYDLKEAIQLVKANAKRNFEETFEAHVKLTPDMRRTDLKLSGSVLLPSGSGKKYRVAVFAEGDAAVEAKEAGAAHVGGLEFIEEIKNGKKFDFDKCFATHQMMKHVLKIARRLKRGMMPNPENGTVTNDMSKAVKEAVSQTVLFQKDKTAIVHVPLGKVNFSEEALRDNIGAFMNALLLAKPAGLKKTSKYAGYVSTIHVCSTMGPSFPVTVQSVSMAVDRYNKLRMQI